MSKAVFTSILKSSLQLSRSEMDAYWQLAMNASLPSFVFDLVSPSFMRLPQVHNAYVAKRGFKPIPMTKQQARRFILEALIDGPRYMKELRELYTIPTEMRLEVVAELLDDKKICFAFCPIGNCMAYELNRRIRVPESLVRRVNTYIRANKRISLFHFYEMVARYDYSVFCVLAGNILNRDYGCVGLKLENGITYLCLKEDEF